MCSSTYASGRAVQPRLPAQPLSSSRKTTTPSPGRPSASTASSPATTPSVPSNLPAPGTVSRCEPVQTWRLAARNPPDQVAGGVDLDLEPGLAEPAGRQLVRRVLLGRVADPVADRGQLFEALEDPHPAERTTAVRLVRSARSTSHPASGNAAASPYARLQEPAETTAAKARGAPTPPSGENRLLDTECRAASGSARQLGDGGEGDAVPGHRQRAGDDERRDEQDQRRLQQRRGDGESDAHRNPDPGERDDARAQRCPTSGRHRSASPSPRPGRRRARRLPGPSPSRVRRGGRGRRSRGRTSAPRRRGR